MLSTKEKLIKARVQLQRENPFFSYLVMNLKLIEDKNLPMPSCAVDNAGNFYYHPDFIEGCYDKGGLKAIQTALAHEVLHLCLEHHKRSGKRCVQKCNIAMDLCVNYMLKVNNFDFGFLKGIITPDDKNEWHYSIIGKNGLVNGVIKDVDKKSFEIVYNELPEPVEVSVFGGGLKQNDNGELLDVKGIGSHDKFGDSKEDNKGVGKGCSNDKSDSLNSNSNGQDNKDWQQVLLDAYNSAKMRGNTPAGFDRIIKDLVDGKVNWKALLYKYIIRETPYDLTWQKYNRKSISCGIPLPDVEREGVDIVVSVDTSGSICSEEMTDFLSEIVSIARSFDELHMTLLVCDCQIHQVFEVSNGNMTKIIDLAKTNGFKGGGGTAHLPVIDWVKNNKPQAKCLVSLTDGYSDIETSFKQLFCDKIIVLSKDSINVENMKPYGEVVKIKDN